MMARKKFSLHHLLLAFLVQNAFYQNVFTEAWSPVLPRSLARKLSFGLSANVVGTAKQTVERRFSAGLWRDSNMVPMQALGDQKPTWRRKILYRVFSLCILALATFLLPPRVAVASDVPLATASVAAGPVATAPVAAVAVAQTATQRISLLHEIRLSMRLVFAAILGSLLGWERSSKQHSAGIRTMALVSLGAATFTICSSHMFIAPGLKYDPSRMAANVASGVGFIGAGVITTPSSRNNLPNGVHGLTTAAAIWISAAVGVAAGAGLYIVSSMASVATIAILRLGKKKKKLRDSKKSADGKRVTESISSQTNSNREVFIVADDEPLDPTIWDEHHIRPRTEEIPKVRVRQSSNIRNDTIPNELTQAIQDAVRRAADQEVLGRTITRGLNPNEMAGVPLWNATTGDEASPSTYGP